MTSFPHMNPTHYDFHVTEAQANLILQALGKQPLEAVLPLFQELQRQAGEQQQEKAPPAPAIVP